MIKLPVLDMTDVCTNLYHLNLLLEGEQPMLYEFGRFLAQELKADVLNPIGFRTKYQICLCALWTGQSEGFLKGSIPQKLLGLTDAIYEKLGGQFQKIAWAVLPEQFAQSCIEIEKATRTGYAEWETLQNEREQDVLEPKRGHEPKRRSSSL